MKKLFVLGNPRSGTSLLRIMLNCHSEIIAPPECGFVQWWFEKYKDWNYSDSHNPQVVQRFLTDLFTSKKIETWDLDKKLLEESIANKKPANYETLTELIYCAWGGEDVHDPKWIVDKNNYFIHHLSDLEKIWPECHFLMIVRDGRDVACSYLETNRLNTNSTYKPNLPNKMAEIAIEWTSNNQMLLDFLKSKSNVRYLIIKYENLILDTEQTLSDICDFMGLSFDNQMLQYYNYHSEPLQTLDWKYKTQEKPDNTRIGRFKKDLTAKELEIFVDRACHLLQIFNYL